MTASERWQLGEGLFKLGNIKLDHKELGKSILFTIYVIPPHILWHRLWNLNGVDFFSTMQPNTLNPGQDIFYHDRRQGGEAPALEPTQKLCQISDYCFKVIFCFEDFFT